MSLVLFFAARHVLNASTFIFRSLRLCVGILLWLDVRWRYGVVRHQLVYLYSTIKTMYRLINIRFTKLLIEEMNSMKI